MGLILGEQSLAQIVYQLQSFMEDKFGRYSTLQKTMTKLPFQLFRNFSVNGSLHAILRTAVSYMVKSKWDKFDILSGDRKQDGLSLLRQIESVLIKSKLLHLPVIYFGKVPEESLDNLRNIVLKHGGSVTGCIDVATHVVEWDDEVDSLPDDLTEEYVRTLAVHPLEAGGIAQVHWYYYPDSYDEWIPSQDVDGTEPPDSYPTANKFSAAHAVDPNIVMQPWKVCCRFIRDCELFNEWCNEIDYEIQDESDDEVEADDQAGDQSPSPDKKAVRSPSSNRKSKKEKGKGGSSASANSSGRRAASRNDTVVVGSTTACTDRIMQDVPPPSLDPNRGPFLVVEVTPTPSSSGATAASTSSGQQFSSRIESPRGLARERGSAPAPVDEADAEAGTGAGTGTNRKRKSTAIESKEEGVVSYKSSTAPSSDRATRPLDDLMSVPDWFDNGSISDMEVKYLPSFFCQDYNAEHREIYILMRSSIIGMYLQSPTVYLSATDCRRRIAGDACAIIKLHEFMDAFGIINTFVRPESRPALPVLTAAYSVAAADHQSAAQSIWTHEMDLQLIKLGYSLCGDWIKVSEAMRRSYPEVTAEECLSRFVELPSDLLLTLAPDSDSAMSVEGDPASAARASFSKATQHSLSRFPPGFLSAEMLQVVATLGQDADVADSAAPAAPVAAAEANLSSAPTTNQSNGNKAKSFSRTALAKDLSTRSLNGKLSGLGALLDDYVIERLSALEEKALLLSAVERELDLSRQQLALERRDVQVQRALIASQPVPR